MDFEDLFSLKTSTPKHDPSSKENYRNNDEYINHSTYRYIPVYSCFYTRMKEEEDVDISLFPNNTSCKNMFLYISPFLQACWIGYVLPI